MNPSNESSSSAAGKINASGFTVEEATDHFWICDGGRRVVLFIRMPQGGFYCNAVFLHQPDAPSPEFPESYHSAKAIGVQADIRWRWGGSWQAMERSRLSFSNDQVEIGFERRSAEGRNQQDIALTLRRRGDGPTDYVLNCRSRLLADTSQGQSIEFLNYLPADAGNSWADKKRFRATIDERVPGGFERRPHSQLTVIEPYYWPDATGFRRTHVAEPAHADVFNATQRVHGAKSPYAVSHLYKPFPAGGLMFFEGEAVAPAVRVLRANAPVVLHTCDVWYDEHFCLEHGVAQTDGRFLYEAVYELFALPQAEAARIGREAVDVLFSAWTTAHEFAPFYTDRLNTFSKPAARDYNGATGLFFAYENPAHLVSWQRQTDLADRGAIVLNTISPVEPPSGQYYQSARYSLAGATPWVETFPLGFSLHLERGSSVGFSALIRIEGDVQAWVELREAYWGKFQQENRAGFDVHVAKSSIASSGVWTRVEGTLTAKIPGSLSMVFLAMSGRGRAWFAELVVKRMP